MAKGDQEAWRHGGALQTPTMGQAVELIGN